MNALNLIYRLHEHRMWVNARLLAAAAKLDDAALRQPLPIGQGSVWRTLTHLYAAEYVWLEALLGDPAPTTPGDVSGQLPGNQQGDQALTTLTDLADAWQQLDTRWQDYLHRLTEPALNEWVHKISTSSGAGRAHATRRSDILLHICTHAQYTTAQLNNMLRQLGQTNLPDVMLITLARQEQPAT